MRRIRKLANQLNAGKSNLIASLLRRAIAQDAVVAPPLPLLGDISRTELFHFVTSIRVKDAPAAEMYNYASQDFERFLRTVGLVDGLKGQCLELGANPYFTTLLLREFTELEPIVANYFDETFPLTGTQTVEFEELCTGEEKSISFDYQHFNVESADFPYETNSFDVVIFAEIIEHLLNDPCAVLREIHRVLKPDGYLVLTTPNVARLENVARLLSGANIYDPYSGYGAYGRHNREYNQHELHALLTHEGFEPEVMYSADVHDSKAGDYWDISELRRLVGYRADGLGQYLFTRSRVKKDHPDKRPSWLYRSYASDQLD